MRHAQDVRRARRAHRHAGQHEQPAALGRETGLTPHQYALQLRLRRSLLALERGPARLATLAQAAGFSSHGHFSNAFRATWGLTPRQYAGQLPRARTPRL